MSGELDAFIDASFTLVCLGFSSESDWSTSSVLIFHAQVQRTKLAVEVRNFKQQLNLVGKYQFTNYRFST